MDQNLEKSSGRLKCKGNIISVGQKISQVADLNGNMRISKEG